MSYTYILCSLAEAILLKTQAFPAPNHFFTFMREEGPM